MSDLNKMTKAELVALVVELQTTVSTLQREVSSLKCESVVPQDNIEELLTLLKERGASDIQLTDIHKRTTKHKPLWDGLKVVKNTHWEFTMDSEAYAALGEEAKKFNGWLARQCVEAGLTPSSRGSAAGWFEGRFQFRDIQERIFEKPEPQNFGAIESDSE